MKKFFTFTMLVIIFTILIIMFFTKKQPKITLEQKRNDVINLTQKAVKLFNNEGKEQAFKSFNNTRGDFIQDDLYIFAYDFDGNCVAIGKYSERIDNNYLEDKDDNDKYFIKELIQKAKDGGGWVDYIWKNSPKSSYVEKVEDKKTGTSYFIGAGFQPDSN